MKPRLFALTLMCCAGWVLVMGAEAQTVSSSEPASGQERHLRNIKQLTFGGQNAEAYFSGDGKQLIFQSTRDPYKCDQIFTMNLEGSDVNLVSTAKGRTTCSYL